MSHEFGSSQEAFCRRNPVLKISNKIQYGGGGADLRVRPGRHIGRPLREIRINWYMFINRFTAAWHAVHARAPRGYMSNKVHQPV
jgi:hypothetical protein